MKFFSTVKFFQFFQLLNYICLRATEVVHSVKVPWYKLDNQSLVPGTHKVEGENRLM